MSTVCIIDSRIMPGTLIGISGAKIRFIRHVPPRSTMVGHSKFITPYIFIDTLLLDSGETAAASVQIARDLCLIN